MQGGFVDLIKSAFPTFQTQLLGTLGILLVLLVLGEAIRRLGPGLKSRFSTVAVETVQATVISLLSVVAAGVMVVIWGAAPQLMIVVDTLEFGRTGAIKAAITVALLAGSYTFTRGTKRLIRKLAQERGAISEHQQEIAHHVVQLGVIFVTVLVVLSLWGVPVKNLLLGAGFLGVILGFAARQTLSAVLAGFIVLFSRPFELGDWIEIDDREGIVQDISIVNTRIRTFDDEIVMIPNDVITSTEIVNRSRSGRYRTHVDVGVDYDTNLDDAVDIAEDVLAATELPMERPRPHVILTEFGGSAIVLRLRFWISNPTSRRRWRAKTEVIEAVKDAFDAEGIKIPFPQRELMARQAEGGFRLSGDVDVAKVAAIAGQRGEQPEAAETTNGDEAGADADEPAARADADEDESDEQPDESDPDP